MLFSHPAFGSDSFCQAGAEKSANEKGSDNISSILYFPFSCALAISESSSKSSARQRSETHFISMCFKLSITFHFNKMLISQKCQALNSLYKCFPRWPNLEICRRWSKKYFVNDLNDIVTSSEAVSQSSASASVFLTIT